MNWRKPVEPETMADVVKAIVAAKRLNPEIGYIGSRIFVPAKVRKSSGDFDYVGIQSLTAAEVNRAAGTDLARAVLASQAGSFSTKKVEKRHIIPERQAQIFGSMEAADEIGTTASCSIVLDQHEDDAAAALFGLAKAGENIVLMPEAADGGIFPAIQRASGAIRAYEGTRSLVCSETWFANFIFRADVQKMLKETIGITQTAQLIDQFYNTTAGVTLFVGGPFGVKQVMVGDDRFFSRAGLEDVAAVVKLPDLGPAPSLTDVMSVMVRRPIFGVGFWNLPDPADPTIMFQAEAAWDNGCKANAYDATGEYDQEILNAGAAIFIQLPEFAADLIPVTTTTTTATTAA